MKTGELIEDFLSQKRIAIVGVSRSPGAFSLHLFREFLKRGYDVVPVNPKASEIAGNRCFCSVCEVKPPVSGALLMVRAELTPWVVRTCLRAGVWRVWMHRGEGLGAVNLEAVEFCHQNGIQVIVGYCPLMFLAHPGLLHRAHGVMMKLQGHYPS